MASGTEIVRLLRKKFKAASDGELVGKVFRHAAQVSSFKKNLNITPLKIAGLVERSFVLGTSIHGRALIEELKRVLGMTTLKELAQKIDLSVPRLSQLQRESFNLRKIARLVKDAHEGGVGFGLKNSVLPGVDLFPIRRTVLGKKGKCAVLDKKSKNKYEVSLMNWMRKEQGVFIFYASDGTALYVGKTEKQTLWAEINSVFNRPRSNQSINLVRHPVTKGRFSPAHQFKRRIKRVEPRLRDFASFFSAYKVHPKFINRLETILIQAFPNDLRNASLKNTRN